MAVETKPPRIHRTYLTAGATIAFVVVVGVVLFSPWVMRWALGDSATWQEVSGLGQAYSGAAALLSALTLLGVAIVVLLQWRSLQAQLKAQTSQQHFEIIRLSMEVPELRTFGMGTDDPDVALQWRRANLWMTYWAELWDIRELNEQGLRNLVAANLADEELVHVWWERHVAAGGWSQLKGRRRSVFEKIVTDEFRRHRSLLPTQTRNTDVTVDESAE